MTFLEFVTGASRVDMAAVRSNPELARLIGGVDGELDDWLWDEWDEISCLPECRRWRGEDILPRLRVLHGQWLVARAAAGAAAAGQTGLSF